MKKMLALLLSVLAMEGVCSGSTQAAASIATLTLEIDSELSVGGQCREDDIQVTVKKGKCTVEDMQILNGIDRWENNTVPKVSIYLHAEEGNYFSVKRTDITIQGGTYVSARMDNPYILEVTVTLPSMAETLGEFTDMGWESSTVAAWAKVENAGYYEVRLFRDGKSTGATETTQEPRIDLGSQMLKAGTYSYRVRAVNKRVEETKSPWAEPEETSYVDEALAGQMRALYGNPIPEGVTEPGQVTSQVKGPGQYGWILDQTGWWYRNSDNSYTANDWQLIDGKWYYFNSSGYMVTGWIQWNGKSYYCDPVNGDMQVSKMIEDGSGRRVDSTGAWIQ